MEYLQKAHGTDAYIIIIHIMLNAHCIYIHMLHRIVRRRHQPGAARSKPSGNATSESERESESQSERERDRERERAVPEKPKRKEVTRCVY